jgi:hypothetical protein
VRDVEGAWSLHDEQSLPVENDRNRPPAGMQVICLSRTWARAVETRDPQVSDGWARPSIVPCLLSLVVARLATRPIYAPRTAICQAPGRTAKAAERFTPQMSLWKKQGLASIRVRDK